MCCGLSVFKIINESTCEPRGLLLSLITIIVQGKKIMNLSKMYSHYRNTINLYYIVLVIKTSF